MGACEEACDEDQQMIAVFLCAVVSLLHQDDEDPHADQECLNEQRAFGISSRFCAHLHVLMCLCECFVFGYLVWQVNVTHGSVA